MGIWIPQFKIWKHSKSWLFEDRVSNGPIFKGSGYRYGYRYGYSYGPNYLKTGPFKIQTFLSILQIVFDKMAAFCQNFKWLGFPISDPIQNPDYLQTNLFSTTQTKSRLVDWQRCLNVSTLKINPEIQTIFFLVIKCIIIILEKPWVGLQLLMWLLV